MFALLALATLGDTTQMDQLYLCHITQAIQGKLGTYFCGVKHSSLFANNDEIFL
jgi:hypothetical protein